MVQCTGVLVAAQSLATFCNQSIASRALITVLPILSQIKFAKNILAFGLSVNGGMSPFSSLSETYSSTNSTQEYLVPPYGKTITLRLVALRSIPQLSHCLAIGSEDIFNFDITVSATT